MNRPPAFFKEKHCGACKGRGWHFELDGKAVHAERERQGLSLRAVATKAGISHVFLSDVEHGRRVASAGTARLIVRALVRPAGWRDHVR